MELATLPHWQHFRPRLRALLLLHRRKPSGLDESHGITFHAIVLMPLCQHGPCLSNYGVSPYLYASLPPTYHAGSGSGE